jgi:hypothetical protein
MALARLATALRQHQFRRSWLLWRRFSWHRSGGVGWQAASVQAASVQAASVQAASVQAASVQAASAAVEPLLAALPLVAPRSRMPPVAERPGRLLEDSAQAV